MKQPAKKSNKFLSFLKKIGQTVLQAIEPRLEKTLDYGIGRIFNPIDNYLSGVKI